MSFKDWLKRNSCYHDITERVSDVHASCKCGKNSRYYGWKKPKEPSTLKRFGDSGEIVVTVIPDTIDLSPLCPPVWNQGSQGSCTGFSSASAVTYQRMKQGELTNPPNDSDRSSPEFIYTCTRIAEGSFPADSGASISDTVKTIMTLGSAPEKDMPYNEDVFNQKPTPIAYADALKIHGLNASVIYGNDVDLIDAALANGYTVLVGITVCSSFESGTTSKTGNIPMPALNADGSIAETILGGHAIEITGKHPDSTKTKRVYDWKNSWGPDWGNKGYGTLLEDYLKNPNLSDDWHVIKLMT